MGRRLVASTVLPLTASLLLLVGACSGGGETSPVDVLTSAGDRTVEAGSARMALVLTMSGEGDEIEISGDGITDFDDESAQVTLDMAPLFSALGVEGDDGTVEARTFGTVVYIRAPIITNLLGLSTPWMVMDLEKVTDEQVGADLGQLGSFTNNDPRQTLAILEGSTEGAVDEVGTEEVRGVEATHYRARVDLRKAYEQSDAIVDRDRFEAFLDQLGTETLEVDAWIDEEGLPRRIAYETPFPGQDAGGARLTLELYDFGVDAQLTRPPQDEVTDLLELVGQ